MKTMLRSLFVLLFFTAPIGLYGAPPPDMATAGKFLVLRNGRTLEGDIQRIEDQYGDQYRVRRDGGETMIPANQVLRLFLDTEDAYKFLRGKANLKDADERLRLARWCLEFNLRQQAEEEVSVALVLRPNDVVAKRLLERIRQAPAAAVPPPASASTPAVPEATVAPIELTPEALGQFTHKVQPILINACASCHAAGHGDSFKLMRISEVATLNRRATQENLAAVLGQIKYDQLSLSPLLTKAVSIHGGMEQAPLKGRQSVPFQVIEEWLRTTLANNPQLLERAGVAAVVPPPALRPESKTVFAETKLEAPPTIPVTPVTPAVGPVNQVPVPPPPPVKPAEGGEVCDPADFNRVAYPERDTTPKP